MEALAIGFIALFGSLMGAGASGFILWRILSRKLVEPKIVYEDPPKKRAILVPGDGVYQVHEKRKCKHMNEEDLATKERNKLSS